MAKAIMLSGGGDGLFELFYSDELTVAMTTVVDFNAYIQSLALDTTDTIYYLDVTNNKDTSNLAGLYALVDGSVAFRRRNNFATQISTTFSFQVTAGAIINIWRKPK